MATREIPTFDLGPFLDGTVDADACKAMADFIRDTGILVVKDPRVPAEANAEFTELMQRYYSQPVEDLMKDARPECFYQVGVTPENVECAKCAKDPSCLKRIDEMPEEHRPHKPKTADPKWRFFWRIGERPESSEFPEQNLEPVVPAEFAAEWPTTMNSWGDHMLKALETSCEMLALGLGLDRMALRELLHQGPHLLAPTGSDLARYSEVDTIFAGWHTDLNFLTIHGKSNFPGLYIWLSDGTKMPVKVPPGCLLIQAGQQIEYITAGYIKAGYHEVVVDENTVATIGKMRETGGCGPSSLWRISSTMFGTVRSDANLTPFEKFADQPNVANYPPIKAGQQVLNELKSIGMADAAAAA